MEDMQEKIDQNSQRILYEFSNLLIRMLSDPDVLRALQSEEHPLPAYIELFFMALQKYREGNKGKRRSKKDKLEELEEQIQGMMREGS